MNITKIDTHLKKKFDTLFFEKIDTINGIQVAHSKKEIKHFAVAVDSSLPILQAAAKNTNNKKIDALFVHHGIYWGQVTPIVGNTYEKIKLLLDSEITLYALHLPLDAHTTLGNNAQLAQRLGLQKCKPFGTLGHSHIKIGIQGILNVSLSPAQVIKKLFALPKKNDYPSYGAYSTQYGLDFLSVKNTQQAHFKPLTTALCGTKKIKSIALVSGTGHNMLDEAHNCDVDMLITGDASHTAFLRAQELKINLVSAGHYFTEIWGVLALGKYIKKLLISNSKPADDTCTCTFIDAPSGH